MADNLLDTIETLSARAMAKEEEAHKLKTLVNELCREAGIAVRFGNIPMVGAGLSLRSDQFYGLGLTTAVRNYLELRKASGLSSASLTDIFTALKAGGFKFGTTNEKNARIIVGNAVRKTSAVFHRVPNGEYGLLSWYPNAKATSEDGEPSPAKKRRGKKHRKNTTEHQETKTAQAPERVEEKPFVAPAAGHDNITNDEIRQIVLAQPGNFQNSDIWKAINAKHPNKLIPQSKVSTVLYLLKGEKKIKVVTERNGKIGAVFCKT
jgi:hypothetical protein